MKKMKKSTEIILVSLVFLLLFGGIGGFLFMKFNKEEVKENVVKYEWNTAWYDESAEEYVITTKEELFGLAELSETIDFKGKTIKLGNDIVINEGNAKDWETKAPELSWIPIMNFAGTFDGQGNSIVGLYAHVTKGEAGMFTGAQEGSKIKDFRLENSYIFSQTSKGTGSIVGSGSGTIERVYTDVIIACNGFYCGGIIGNLKDEALVKECWFDGSITIQGSCAGGIAASANNGHSKVLHCLNTGTVTSTYQGPDAAIIGGIIGAVTKKVDIEDTLNVGSVVSEAGLEQVGGILGVISGGTVKMDALWTGKECAPEAVGYAKSGFDGLYGERKMEHLKGFNAYQRTNLDFEQHWAVVEDGTPTLQYFTKTIPEIPEMERALVADISWYDIKKNEFVINTPAELLGFGQFTQQGYGNRFNGKTVKLGKDIVFNTGNATDYAKKEPLNEWVPIYNYTGTFDGCGHTISGLYAKGLATEKTGTGLFSYGREMTVIKNLKLVNSYFKTDNIYGMGAIVGRGGGKIYNVYADAILESAEQGSIGGIFGFATRQPVMIDNCWSDCDITTSGRRVGGILGNGNGRTDVSITHCLNTGTLTRSFKHIPADHSNRKLSSLFGGIIGGTGGGNNTTGYTGSFLIEDCFNTGLIQSEKENDGIGGVVGTATGNQQDGTPTITVKNSYCTKTSCEKVIGAQNSQAIVLDVARLDERMVTGAEAYFYTSLNFKKYWAAMEGKTPMLQSFAAGNGKTVAVDGERIDTSWFVAGKNEFTITTKSQLYGFMMLSYGGEKFINMTMKLGADIVANPGVASDWAAGTQIADRKWEPIYNFQGTFDGQGHHISGIYGIATGVHADRNGMGMFIESRSACTIKNFTLRNSYFESTYANGLGAISGRGGGTFANLHVGNDVYLKNKICGSVGGVLGMATRTTNIENCWSEANIQAAGAGIGGIVGNGNAQTVTIKHCLNTGNVARSFEGHLEALALYDYASYPSYYKDSTNVAGYIAGIIGKTGGGKAGAYTGNFVIEDCVNLGMITTERNGGTTAGIVAQTTGNTAEGVPTVTIKNCYTSSSCCSKAIVSQNAQTVVSECIAVNDSKLIGVNAFYNTELDFAKNWSARKDTTPMLTYFLTSTDVVENIIGLTKDEFSLNSDNHGFIANLKQLESFRKQLNDGSLKVNKDTVITMTADIVVNEGNAKKWAAGKELPDEWIPINGFTGTFDGGGYSISGLYVNSADSTITGRGLFTKTNGAVIKNLKIVNSFYKGNVSAGTGVVVGQGNGTFENIYTDAIMIDTAKKGRIGGIIGQIDGNTTVRNCWVATDIDSNNTYVGGIFGNISASGYQITIEHCLNSGNLTYTGTGNSYFGGFVGRANTASPSGGLLTVTDCLNVGVVSGTTKQTYMGGLLGFASKPVQGQETTVITNSYSATHSTGIKVAVGSDNRTNKTGATVLNYDLLLGETALTNASALVYKTEQNPTGFWTTREEKTPMLVSFLEYSKYVDEKEEAEHKFTLTDNKGTIENADQLRSFRDAINAGDLIVDKDTVITLTDDIVFNEGWTASATVPDEIWIPIVGFPGTFDGAGYTISGIYTKSLDGIAGIGFFTGTTETTVIKNLSIKNSYFRGNSSKGTGALVGTGAGTFQGIYTEAIIWDKDTKGNQGGILGVASGTVLVENCWANCQLESNSINLGGIVGSANGMQVTIKHCLNTSEIIISSKCTASNAYAGGIIGKTGTGAGSADKPYVGKVQIEDCLSTGMVKTESTKTTKALGGIVGYATGASAEGTPTVAVVNSYCAVHSEGTQVAVGVNKGARVENCDAIALSKLQGDSALTNASGLNYKTETNKEGFWTTRSGAFPILVKFLSYIR